MMFKMTWKWLDGWFSLLRCCFASTSVSIPTSLISRAARIRTKTRFSRKIRSGLGNWFSNDFCAETRGVETAGVVTCATLPMYGAFTNTSPPQDSFPPSFSFFLPRPPRTGNPSFGVPAVHHDNPHHGFPLSNAMDSHGFPGGLRGT